MRRSRIVLVCVVAAFTLAPVTASADLTGTVESKVTGATPCISVDSGLLVDFGTLAYSRTSATLTATATDATMVTNCSGISEAVSAQGSNATNAANTATWTLQGGPSSNPCLLQGGNLNKYYYEVHLRGFALLGPVGLSSNQSNGVSIWPGGQQRALEHIITMPCVGSSGGGQVMTMHISLIAELPDN